MSTKLKLRNIDGWLMARKSVKGGEYTHTKIGVSDIYTCIQPVH